MPGVAGPADAHVGDIQDVRFDQGQLGLRQVDRVRDQLAGRSEDALHCRRGSAPVAQQRRVGVSRISDRRDVHRLRTGERCLRGIEIQQAGVDAVSRYHDHARPVRFGHHHVHLLPGAVQVGARLCDGSRRLRFDGGQPLLGRRHGRARGIRIGLSLGGGGTSCGQAGSGPRLGLCHQLARRGWQLDRCQADQLEAIAAGVTELAGVAIAADPDVGHVQHVRSDQRQLGVRQVDRVGDQLPGRAEHLVDSCRGATPVAHQRRVGIVSIPDSGNVDRLGTAHGDRRVVEIQQAGIDPVDIDHYRARPVQLRHHHVHPVARGVHGGSCLGDVGSRRRLHGGQPRLGVGDRGLGGRGCRLGDGDGGFSFGDRGLSVGARFGDVGVGARLGVGNQFIGGRRQGHAPDAGDLQAVVARVAQLAGVAAAADADECHLQGVRRHERQLGPCQVDRVGYQLAGTPEDALHRGGGSPAIPQQCRERVVSIADRGDVDRFGSGQVDACIVEVQQAGIEVFGGNRHRACPVRLRRHHVGLVLRRCRAGAGTGDGSLRLRFDAGGPFLRGSGRGLRRVGCGLSGAGFLLCLRGHRLRLVGGGLRVGHFRLQGRDVGLQGGDLFLGGHLYRFRFHRIRFRFHRNSGRTDTAGERCEQAGNGRQHRCMRPANQRAENYLHT